MSKPGPRERLSSWDRGWRVWARGKVAKEIRAGFLVRPCACPQCDVRNQVIEAHHPNYRDPLRIEWLCRTCHRLEHKRLKAEAVA